MLCVVNDNTLAVVDDVSQPEEVCCLGWQEDSLQGDLQAGIAWSTPLIILGVIIELFQFNIAGIGALVIAAIHMVCAMALLLASKDEAKITRLKIVFTVVLLCAGLISVTGMARHATSIASLAIIIAGIIGMAVTTLMTLASIPAAWGLCRTRTYAGNAQALLSTDTATALPSWQLVESTYDYVRQYNAICRQDPATGAKMDDIITQYAQAAAEGSGYTRMGASPGVAKAVEERIDALHQAAQQQIAELQQLHHDTLCQSARLQDEQAAYLAEQDAVLPNSMAEGWLAANPDPTIEPGQV